MSVLRQPTLRAADLPQFLSSATFEFALKNLDTRKILVPFYYCSWLFCLKGECDAANVRMDRVGLGAGLNLQSGSFRAILSLTAKQQLSNPLQSQPNTIVHCNCYGKEMRIVEVPR